MVFLLRLLSTLLPTIAIEYGVLVMMGERTRRVLVSSVVVNCLTNVPLNVILLLYGQAQDGVKGLLAAEGIIVVIEAVWYYVVARLPVWRASVCSLLCNAISFLTGILFQTTYYLLTQ